MWLNLLLLIIALAGCIGMWQSITGKKEEIEKISFPIASNLVEILFKFSYEFSPTFIKRILLFLICFVTAVLGTLGAVYA